MAKETRLPHHVGNPGQDTEPQDQKWTAQDQAGNAQSRENTNRWVHDKNDVKSATDIRNGQPNPQEGLALEEPGHLPVRESHGKVVPESPDDFSDLYLHAPHHKAAGLPAVLRAMQYVLPRAGVLRGTHGLLVLNQAHGIDCMSCAWPQPDEGRSAFEFCENGAKALGHEMDKRRCGPEFFAAHSVEALSQQSDYWLEQQGRLTHPMVLRAGATHYEPISWEDAFSMIAEQLNTLSCPDRASFYTSGRASNEAAFCYQLFVRQFGTNNLPDCSNMCHESSGSALSDTLGIGKGTATLADFEKCQLILIIGQNPGTNHPRMLTTLQRAKKRGAKIIAVNPLREAGLLGFMNPQTPLGLLGSATPLADLFIQVRINGDMALLKGVLKEMLAVEEHQTGAAFDWDFIRAKTHGVDDLLNNVRVAEWDPIVADSGVSRAQIKEMADMVIANEGIIACWAMGLTQQKDGVLTIQEVVNLLLLRGAMGKPGAGACPVRGHSNVQGDRTMGIWERPRTDLLDCLEKNFNFKPPRHHGYDSVETIHAMHEGKVKVFVQLGGNFFSAGPDTRYLQESFTQLDLQARIGTKLNRSDLVTGKQALILPCLGRSDIDRRASGEQFITTENSMGEIEQSRGRFQPPSELVLSEVAIICGIAKATLQDRTTVPWDVWASDYDKIRDAIGRTIPGCENYNARVRNGLFYLPNKARDNEYLTSTGKANFTVNPLPEHKLAPSQLVLMTIRSHDQFNTTIYGPHDRYRGIHGQRRVILMHKDDISARGLGERQYVDITSHFNGQTRVAKQFLIIAYDIPAGCCATYYPEGNVLIPIGSVADRSNQPTSKYAVVTIAAAATNQPFDRNFISAVTQ